MRLFIASGIAAASFLAAVPAFARPISSGPVYDTSLVSPPGAYVGAGAQNAHYAVSNSNGIEFGLTTVQRFVGNYAPDAGTSTYRVPLGNTTYPNKQGSVFGFTFSLSDQVGQTLGTIMPTLSILDVATGSLVSFNPLTALPDNAGYSAARGTNKAAQPSDTAFQNSETLSFSNGIASGFDPSYDANRNDTYVITLSAVAGGDGPNTGGSLGSVSETIIAGSGAPGGVPVPEPASAALLGMALIGAAVRRRK